MRQHLPIDKAAALSKMMMYCSVAERCASDIAERLKKLELSDSETTEIIGRLYSENFLNDERFLSAFIRDKFIYNKWGKSKIKFQLKQKGFDDATIENSIADNLNDDDYLHSLVNDLQRKNRSIKDDDKYKRKAKLMAFAQSRGYDMTTIIKALGQIDLNVEDL